ncbi:hypothetical protein LB105_004101 [Salmonella enterica]|nr:hypothetical protein [Salmonella enterica]ECB7109790.1 hypothetical protein [Salmonella enterica subsp. enterica serovar Newport]ECD3888952.1 hypothetical protein [Salmonella enterica subsp. enterica serovar Poona]ECD7245165.1 hypothetical protein [Salmonella enterica subsp. enterica serovar Florida]EJI0210192.1 hypothetical protein [Salmonella enterica subsp. enterica]EKQ9927140.1 hypothetical protein [Salmonella enterica subsp. enterica serovar Panama]
MRFQLCQQLNNMNCANRFVTFQQGLRTKRSKMKDDYHLPVVTRPEREARYPGIKKAKPSMVQGLNEHQYNQISNGREVPGMNLLTPYTYNLFSMGMDFFYVLSGVHGESLCPDLFNDG